MGKKSTVLYVATNSWLALPGGMEPIVGTHDDASVADWKGVGTMLRESAGQSRVRVLLSARLCRFGVFPWISSVATGRAMRAHVEEAFAESHAISTQSHHFEIDWPSYGQPVLAVAYPRTLIEALRDGLVETGHVPSVVDSSMGPVLRRYGARLGPEPALLAYAEDDGMTAVTVEDDRVAQVEMLADSGHGLDELVVWAARKRLLHDDGGLHWLATADKPREFPGGIMALEETGEAMSAGHALSMTWR